MKPIFYSLKGKLSHVILFFSFLSFIQVAQATSYYFSTTSGDDLRTPVQAQNQSTPWKSIGKLNSMFGSFVAGDSILFKRGEVFTGSINITKAGLIFSAYGAAAINPVISGFTDLIWTNIGGNMWESQALSVRPYLVLINDTYTLPSRMPKTGYYTYESSGGTNRITDNQLTGDWNGGEVVVRKNHTIWDKGTISQSGTSITFPNQYGDGFINGYGYFIQNHVSACTQQNEWAYSNSTKKITLYSTANPTNSKASQVSTLINDNGYSAVVDGIDLTGSNGHAVNAIHISSGGFKLRNSNITNSGDRGVYLWDSPNSVVENCTLLNTNATGIEGSTCANIIVRGNTLTNTGIEGQGIGCEGQGMVFINQCTGGLAEFNSITNTGHNGMNIYFSSNFTAQKNFVNTFNKYKEDGAGIYTWLGFNNGVYTNVKILNNIVINGVGAAASRPDKDYQPSFGIYLDDQVANTTVSGNTVAGCAQSGIFLHNANNNTITNNLLYNNGNSSIDATRASQMFLQDDGGYHAGLVCTGNVFFARETYQFPFKADYSTNTIGSSFTPLNNNYYCHPIKESSFVSRTYVNGTPTALEHSLAGWKTYTGQEATGAYTARTITSTSQLRFEYNPTASSVMVSLGATYVDSKGTTYAGSITLAPYAAAVLIYQSGTINQPPTANAGANQSITLPLNTVTLNGSGTDTDGTIASYQWTKIAGPTSFTIGSPTLAQTAIGILLQGTYQFELRVTDNQGAVGRDTVSVLVNPLLAVNIAPTANAGANQTITLPVNTVTLNGSGTDVDGTIASYQWTKIAGPATFTIASTTLAQTTINNLIQGTYQFQLQVTDNQGAIGTNTVTITVNPALVVNIAPTANAGANQTITLPVNTVTLNGSGTDIDGTIASYQWTKIAGPATFTIASATLAQTAINNLIQGTYQFELRVTDNQGAIGRDTISVSVNPAPVVNIVPTANAGANQTITLPINTVTLNGSGTDVDGTIASYQWTKIAGPATFLIGSATLAQTAINNLVQGTYQFQLQVTDNQGAVGRDTISVSVNPAPVVNIAPTANAGVNQTITLPINTVTLNGSGTDTDGTIASYQWTKIAGPTTFTIASATLAQTAINNLVQGTYQFELRVTDNQGAVGRDTITVSVNPAPVVNIAPTANAGVNQTITLPINTVTLNGSGTDVDGTIASYQWTKIAGPATFAIGSATLAQTAINNLVQGTYQFQLQVTDNQGAIGTSTVTITVNPAPVVNIAPTANAGANQTITLPVNTVTLNGSGADVDGTIASYQWTKIAGPAIFTIGSATQAQTAINNLIQGTYQFQLRVTDNQGAIGTSTVTITVNPAPVVNIAPTANAGANQTITLPINTVTLNGSGTDVDGTIASYQWTKIAGPTSFTIVSAASAQTVINNLVQGTYQFQLRVTDNQGASGTSIVTIIVNPAPVVNIAPTANAGVNQTITLPINTVTLNGSGTDVDGTIASYQWTKIAGPTSFTIASTTLAQTAINSLIQGTYQFELRVTDNQGAVGRDTITVSVNPAPVVNIAPTANAGANQTITLPVNTVTLNGSGTDVDGTIASYQWAKIAGPTSFTIVSAASAQTVINNLVQGTYQFQLRVTDNQGAFSTSTVTITVLSPAPPPAPIAPVANAGADKTIILPTNSVTLNGIGTDADGSIVSYLWTKISGPATFSIGTQNQANTSVNNLVEGVYLFTLRVTDNTGMTGLDTVKVTVNPDLNNLTNTTVVSKVYPNPATTYINVVVDGKNISNKSFISIYNTNGLIVYQQRLDRTQTTTIKNIDLSRLPKGAYVLKIIYSQTKTETMKFMLQ